MTADVSLALIGVGPRGASILERLTMILRDRDVPTGLVIHLIDPAEPGPGAVWRTDQPRSLLMNSPVGSTTLFPDTSMTTLAPPAAGLTLFDWCRAVVAQHDGVTGDDASEPTGMLAEQPVAGVPGTYLGEMRGLTADGYPSRAIYGLYLRWFLRRTLAMLPAGVEVREHRTHADDVERLPDGRYRVALADSDPLVVDAAVLSLGWLPAVEEGAPASTARRIAPATAIDQNLDAIAPGEHLIVRGFGMNFFDSMALLTEGRGGRFISRAGRLRYQASGAEPVLHVGSGRGVPHRSKSEFSLRSRIRLPRTEAVVAARLPDRRPIDLTRELLPAIEADALEAYYRALAETDPHSIGGRLDALVAALGTQRERSAVEASVSDPGLRLDLHRLGRPLDDDFVSPDAFDQALREFVRRELHEGGREVSPLKVAAAVYGAARKAVGPLIRGGRLVPSDYDGPYPRFSALGAALAGGPPPRRMAELEALLDAGMVHGVGPDMRVTTTSSGFEAESPAVRGSRVHATHLLEAWMHRPAVTKSADPLLQRLLDRGLLRAHRVGGIETGAIDVDLDTGRAISANGVAQDCLLVLGVPTEGVQIFTIVSPTIEPNSAFLRETDTVAAGLASLLLSRR